MTPCGYVCGTQRDVSRWKLGFKAAEVSACAPCAVRYWLGHARTLP